MANEAVSLDIDEPQVLIDFFNDENFHWHQRVLLRRIQGSTWLASTPTLDVEIVDLSEHRVLAVARGARFPARAVGNLFAFDPFDEGDLADLHAQANAIADVMGAEARTGPGTAADVAAGHWRVSNPALEDFGLEVGDLLMTNEATGWFRDSVGG